MNEQEKIDAVTDRSANVKRNVLARLTSPAAVSAISGVHPLITALSPDMRQAVAMRLARVAYTAITKNPALLKCTPDSVVAGVVEAAQLGLTVDGVLGQAYLVPYGDKAQMQIGYRGFIALAYRSGMIERFACDTVYDGDLFDYSEGTAPFLNHKKPMTGPRGNAIGAYAIAQLKGTSLPMFRVMPILEVLDHRDRSSGYKAFVSKKVSSSPWDSDPDAMAMKTAIRMLGKLLPVTEIQDASARDEQRDQGLIKPPANVDEVIGEVIDEGGSDGPA